jgi:hypothetical protein
LRSIDVDISVGAQVGDDFRVGMADGRPPDENFVDGGEQTGVFTRLGAGRSSSGVAGSRVAASAACDSVSKRLAMAPAMVN